MSGGWRDAWLACSATAAPALGCAPRWSSAAAPAGPFALGRGLPDRLATARERYTKSRAPMAAASELIDFRRAFLWLLCGMLLPSVALVAFGVVAVANERAAVERRLENEYLARLGALKEALDARLQAAASSAARASDSDRTALAD